MAFILFITVLWYSQILGDKDTALADKDTKYNQLLEVKSQEDTCLLTIPRYWDYYGRQKYYVNDVTDVAGCMQ